MRMKQTTHLEEVHLCVKLWWASFCTYKLLDEMLYSWLNTLDALGDQLLPSLRIIWIKTLLSVLAGDPGIHTVHNYLRQLCLAGLSCEYPASQFVMETIWYVVMPSSSSRKHDFTFLMLGWSLNGRLDGVNVADHADILTLQGFSQSSRSLQ